MTAYIFKRLLLIVPTLFAIMVLNFVIVQAAPGGPIDQIVAQLQGQNTDSTARISGNTGAETGQANQNSGQVGGDQSRGARGLDSGGGSWSHACRCAVRG